MFCGDRDWPETETTGWCCEGSVYRGASGCMCWEPEYDREQADVLALDTVTTGRTTMCGDCAYRPGSPERSGDPQAGATQEDLDTLVAAGDPFWCHDGMRLPVLWRHPSGATVPGSPLDYRPPIVDGRPYKADGTPGDLCAGWLARSLSRARRRTAQG
jgi:hypothetical protein